jgi:hypothetical protein
VDKASGGIPGWPAKPRRDNHDKTNRPRLTLLPGFHTRMTTCPGEKTVCSGLRYESRRSESRPPLVRERKRAETLFDALSCPSFSSVILSRIHPSRQTAHATEASEHLSTSRSFSAVQTTEGTIHPDGTHFNWLNTCSSIRSLGGVLSRAVCGGVGAAYGGCAECSGHALTGSPSIVSGCSGRTLPTYGTGEGRGV